MNDHRRHTPPCCEGDHSTPNRVLIPPNLSLLVNLRQLSSLFNSILSPYPSLSTLPVIDTTVGVEGSIVPEALEVVEFGTFTTLQTFLMRHAARNR